MDHIHGKYIKIPREYKYAYWSDNHKTLHKTETFDIVYYQTTTSKMKTMKKKKNTGTALISLKTVIKKTSKKC